MRQSNWESFPQGIGLGFLKIIELPPPFRHVFFQHLFSPGSIPAPWLVAATSQRRNLSIQLARLRKIPGPRRTKNPGHFTLLQSISKKGNVRKLLSPFIHISGSYGHCIFDFGVLRKFPVYLYDVLNQKTVAPQLPGVHTLAPPVHALRQEVR